MMYFATYNCSGFTNGKIDKIASINFLLSDIHVLFLQELWLIDNHRYKLNYTLKNCNVFSVSGYTMFQTYMDGLMEVVQLL